MSRFIATIHARETAQSMSEAVLASTDGTGPERTIFEKGFLGAVVKLVQNPSNDILGVAQTVVEAHIGSQGQRTPADDLVFAGAVNGALFAKRSQA